MTDYCELDDLKRFVRVPGNYDGTINTEEDTSDDLILSAAISAASRLIDQATNTSFGNVFETRTYTPVRIGYHYELPIDPVFTASGMIVTYSDNEITDYVLTPVNASGRGLPYTEILFDDSVYVYGSNSVTVEAQWGYSEIPAAIKYACMLQASRLYQRRNAPFGVVGSPEQGSELRLLNKLDPDVEKLVQPYKKWWAAF